MARLRPEAWSFIALVFAAACDSSTSNEPAVDRRALSGGATTVFDATSGAFGFPAPNLSSAGLAVHDIGDEGFDATFVTSPAPVNPGLGPLFNNTSCESCHVGDGRGRAPDAGEQFETMLFRLSVPGTDPNGGPVPAAGFGLQLQLRSIVGVAPESDIAVTYTDSSDTFDDGTPYTLQVPTYTISNEYAPYPGNMLISPRVAPANFGLGLLEAITEASILSHTDESDANHDGVSGRPNYVFDAINPGTALGRFGLKANTPNLLQQTAAAYNGDIGVTSSFFPTESCAGQFPSCPSGPPEIDDATMQAVAFYIRTLGVPARRLTSDAEALRGEEIFKAAKCAKCHVPTFTTGTLAGVPEVSDQTIHPYTDLLLHDMGPALADGRPDFLATGSEWRTPPLWGVGLVHVVNGHSNFLHDGRARGFMEAIMWHGGEGRASREYVRVLNAADRSALLRFLGSL